MFDKSQEQNKICLIRSWGGGGGGVHPIWTILAEIDHYMHGQHYQIKSLPITPGEIIMGSQLFGITLKRQLKDLGNRYIEMQFCLPEGVSLVTAIMYSHC